MPHIAIARTRAFVLTLALLSPAAALAEPPAQAPRTITITGQGEAKAAPDSAQLSAGVVTQGATAAAALAANTQAMNGVFAALKSAGVPDKAIQTSDFSVSPRYVAARPGGEENRIAGYQVSNSVSVTLNDLARLGRTLDALVGTGANQINGVSFSLRDPKPLLKQAREQAVRDATERAQTYAAAAGVTLGPILTIDESGSEMPRPMFRAMSAAPMNMIAPTPIAAGEQSVSASVSISWEIR